MFKRALVFLSILILVVTGLVSVGSAQTAATSPSLIVKLVPGLSTEQQSAAVQRCGGSEISTVPALRLHTVSVAAETLDATLLCYQADPLVQRVEVNQVRQAEAVPSDEFFFTFNGGYGQWNLLQIGWDLAFGSVVPYGTAIVAVLDTGVGSSHPELQGKLYQGFSVFDGSNGLVDPNGHGTWLAGIVAAATDNGIGIAGVAFEGVRILPVTVLGADGAGQDGNVIAGVIWAADHGADVILMAFSNPGYSESLQEAIDYAWAQGAVLVAATGNAGSAEPTYPAGDRAVVGVSATDQLDELAYGSNYGPAVFLAAPGTDIPTIALDGSYISIGGTSAAAAIVAGVAGFMKAVDPSLTNGVIVGRLARTADASGTLEQTGNGRVNMAHALADTGTEEIMPEGAPGGGPYVGPYVIAAAVYVTVNVNEIVVVGNPPNTITLPINGARVTVNCPLCYVDYRSLTGDTGLPSVTPPYNIVDGQVKLRPQFANSNGRGTVEVSADRYSTAGKNGEISWSYQTGDAAPVITVTLKLQNTDCPSIGIQPTVFPTWTVGNLVQFSVTAGGQIPLFYQWQKYDAETEQYKDILGAITNEYRKDSVVVSDSGSYRVVVSNSASCDSAVSNPVDFTVNKADPTITWYTPADITYGTPLSSTQLNATASEIGTFIYSPAAGIVLNAGSNQPLRVEFRPNDSANYNVVFRQVAINVTNKKPASVTPDAVSKTYGDADPSFAGTLIGFDPADEVGATFNRTSGETVGRYTISATLSPSGVLDKYDITYNTADFIVTKKSASVTPDAASKTYGDIDPTLTGTLSGFVAGDGVAATYSRTAGSSVGTYPVSAILVPADVLGNYDVTYNTADFTIIKRYVTVTPDAASKTYGDAEPTLTGTLSGFLESDYVYAIYSRTPGETVGTYTINTTLGPAYTLANYQIAISPYSTDNFTITHKAASVTPNAASKEYGGADPAFSGTLSGFLVADGVTAMYGRAAGEGLGTYAISATLSPASALGNYEVTYNAADFIIQDTTPPVIAAYGNVIAVAATAAGSSVSYIVPTATDIVDGSVSVTCSPSSGSLFSIGTSSVSCSAVDAHGNAASASFSIEVKYNWSGFFQPVDNPVVGSNVIVVNTVKAGSAIPVKFSLGGNMGLEIFASGYPRIVSINLTNGILNENEITPIETVTAGASSLTFDSSANQYVYVWKTVKAWVGQAYQLQVLLKDGTVHVANFKFK